MFGRRRKISVYILRKPVFIPLTVAKLLNGKERANEMAGRFLTASTNRHTTAKYRKGCVGMSMRRPNSDGTAATQRKDGICYRTVVTDGKRKHVYGKSEAEVNRKFRKLKEERPETISKNLKRMTVEDYLMN